MGPIIVAGTCVGVLVGLLHALDPSMPTETSRDDLQAKQNAAYWTAAELRQAKVESWRQCAARRKLGLGCHPVAEKGKRR